jgi:hypothetical protein
MSLRQQTNSKNNIKDILKNWKLEKIGKVYEKRAN